MDITDVNVFGGLDSFSGTEDHFLCYIEGAGNPGEDVCEIA